MCISCHLVDLRTQLFMQTRRSTFQRRRGLLRARREFSRGSILRITTRLHARIAAQSHKYTARNAAYCGERLAKSCNIPHPGRATFSISAHPHHRSRTTSSFALPDSGYKLRLNVVVSSRNREVSGGLKAEVYPKTENQSKVGDRYRR